MSRGEALTLSPMSTSPLRVHQPEAAEAQSLSDRAYYAIRELIVTLELAPGSIVSERELQDRLGVGRTPVREALQRLENERLVEVYPRRGIFVSNVNVLDLAVLSEVRTVLEGFGARLAAERATESDRAEIAALIADVEQLTASADERRLMDARPADPPPGVSLHPQPVPRDDARRLLHAHAQDLVPRVEPGACGSSRR